MLSFAKPWEEAETLEDISFERQQPRRQHLGVWVLKEHKPWALLLVACREKDPNKARWTLPVWYLTRWRRRWDVWQNFRDIRLTDKVFKDLLCWGGPLKWARDELVEHIGDTRDDLSILVEPLFRRVP